MKTKQMATLFEACFSSSPSLPPGSRRGVGYKISLLDQAKELGTVSRACHSAYPGPGPSGDVGVDRCPLLWLRSTGQEAEGLGAWRVLAKQRLFLVQHLSTGSRSTAKVDIYVSRIDILTHTPTLK